MRSPPRDNVRRGIRAPLLLLIAVSLLAATCSSDKGGASGSGSDGLETSTITVGSLTVVDAAPAYIAESVYLGDRVLVLSRGPARLVAEIAVPLPQPRDQIATKELDAFVRLRAELGRLIRSRGSVAVP